MKSQRKKTTKKLTQIFAYARDHRGLQAVAFIAIFTVIGVSYKVFSHAATVTYSQVCDFESAGSVHCLNDSSGNHTIGTPITPASQNKNSYKQNFYTDPISDMCNHGKVSSTCPFAIGSGLNNRYKNDPIVQFVYSGNFYAGKLMCLGSGGGGALQQCNNVAGGGGGPGTVFVQNEAGGGGTQGFVESKYWSNYNYNTLKEYNHPSWLCVAGGQVNLDADNSGGNLCRWY